jgi:hypothetical protein
MCEASQVWKTSSRYKNVLEEVKWKYLFDVLSFIHFISRQLLLHVDTQRLLLQPFLLYHR